MVHHPTIHHSRWYKFKTYVFIPFCWTITIGIPAFALIYGVAASLEKYTAWKAAPSVRQDVQYPIYIEVKSSYKIDPTDGVYYKEIKNVGLTYYSRGDGYTPGHTTRSGRFVYEGAIAVSQPLWGKDVMAGDLVFVKESGRWYKVEDTMHSKYTEPRVDIYTHDMALATSGSSKTDIIIMRQPR